MANTSRGLVLLDRASQLLSEATSLDDLKEVRDTAEAARTFAKAARLGLELQNRAAELKLRAERKAGTFLAMLHLRGGNRRSKPQPVTLNLDNLGVTKRQSELWQLAASVSDEDFERYVRGKNQFGQEVTAAGLLRLAKTLRSPAAPVPRARPQQTSSADRDALIGGRAELLSLLSELKSQCAHLRSLLEPLVAGKEVAYKPAERRFIGRLAQDIERTVLKLEQDLWTEG